VRAFDVVWAALMTTLPHLFPDFEKLDGVAVAATA
jgi:hypothetical protein